MKKWCIVGAGAAGCVIAAKILPVVPELTLVARGEHLAALQKNGLDISIAGQQQVIPVAAYALEDITETYDVVMIAVKSHQLPPIAAQISKLLHPETIVMPIGNGIPWWFPQSLASLQQMKSIAVDPDGIITPEIPFAQLVGGLTYQTASIVRPGVVVNLGEPTWKFGEASGQNSARTDALADIATRAGFPKVLSPDIRADIWKKLCWNIVFNPLSVIHDRHSRALAEDADIRNVGFAEIAEMNQMAKAMGLDLVVDPEQVFAIAVRAGDHPPSMLQDYRAGRKLETEAILDSVVQIAKALRVEIPSILSVQKTLAAKM